MAIARKIRQFMERSSWIRRMFEEGNRLRKELGPDRVFDFTLGNPDLEPPEAFRAALKELVASDEKGAHRYMPNAGFPETRAAVASELAAETGLPFRGDHVVMTVGAAGALNIVLKSILDPGDEAVVLAPFFPEFEFYIDNHGGAMKVVPTAADFSLDVAAIERALTPRTKAVIVNSPNNPSGRLYSEDQVAALGNLLARRGGETYLISDEAYKRIVFDGLRFPAVPPHYVRTVVVGSYSKGLSLAGERVGFAAVSPRVPEWEELIRAMIFANRTLGFVNCPALMQRAIRALAGVSVDPMPYQRKRDRLLAALPAAGYDVVRPEGAFYLFPRSPDPDDLAFVRRLAREGVLVVPGSGFGTPGYFRISYAVPDATIEGALAGFVRAARG